jgi:protein-L-isoaspartate(D-aspartate) O-methyltransferase
MRAAVALAESLRSAVRDERVLAAVASIPRELFVPEEIRERAYENVALPIDCGQTISQPLVVARMLEVLEPRRGDRALDVGTGSGYHAALLSLLVAEVWTVERHEQLSAGAANAIDRLELDNVSFAVGDGWLGLPSQAPFDVINVAAATGEERPDVLERQLAPGGRMVAPVGGESQYLTLTRNTAKGLVRERLEGVRFVPLVRDAPR